MFSRFLLFSLLALCFYNSFALHHLKTHKLKAPTSECDFEHYTDCVRPLYILNRAVGYYLGRGPVYNTNGLDAVLDYNYDKWCINNCFITNTVNNLVLDVAESDLTKKQVILWPLHDDSTGNQVWVVQLETTGFWSIRTQTNGSLLALAAVTGQHKVTLVEYNPEDINQQWTIKE